MQKKGLFSSKKGEITEEVRYILIQSVLALTILGTLIFFIYSIENDSLFEKAFLSRDLALLVDTVYAGPGEVKYAYEVGGKHELGYRFTLKDQRFLVEETQGSQPVSYPYARDTEYSEGNTIVILEAEEQKTKKLQFEKKESTFTFDKTS